VANIVVINIESNLNEQALLASVLKKTSHMHFFIDTKKEIFTHLKFQNSDLVLLNDNKLNQDSFLLIDQIRKEFSLPILLLTSSSNMLKPLEALNIGVDQYLSRPYSENALVIHINALLRRVELEKLRLNFQSCSQDFSFIISRLPLTETETLLIQYLSKNSGEVISKSILQKEVLNKKLSTFDRNLDVHVSNIRRKMSMAGLSKAHIKTVHGKGYTFCEKLTHLCLLFPSFCNF